MNRPLKFRAWDGKKMQYQFKINAVDGAITTSWEGKNVLREGWEVMQWTGLTDKNGKEIYEGDICHRHEWKLNPFVVQWPFYFVGDESEYTVVGNVFENPELIEKSV